MKNIARLGFELDTMTVYCSDLTRAVQTAEIVLADSNLPLNLDSRLREMSFGTHEGMCQKEHDKIIIPTSPIGDRLGHRICDGAESRRDVAIRVADFVDEIMRLDGDALVITHGFAASFVIAAFQKLDIESMGHLAFKLTSALDKRICPIKLFFSLSALLSFVIARYYCIKAP